MSLIYRPQYFEPRELIAPRIYAVCGADALYMYDPLILEGADQLRKHFGPMICNTYHSKRLIAKHGRHRFRGLRPVDCKIGASKSAHKVGIYKPKRYSAIDLIPQNISVKEMHKHMRKDQKYWSYYFKRVETHKPNGQYITWFHGDSKPHHQQSPMKFFRP